MSSDRSRQLWLVPVLLITVIVTAVAGLVARNLYEDPAPATPEAVLPSASAVPPAEQPGPTEVQGTPDATAHPLFTTIRDVLQTHFDAVNARDYQRWQTVVTRKRILNEPEEEWRTSYRSTKDGSIVIYRMELAERDTIRVLMTFTSTQDPRDAPPELPVPCIHWNVVFPLVQEDDGWKLDTGSTAASPQHEACA